MIRGSVVRCGSASAGRVVAGAALALGLVLALAPPVAAGADRAASGVLGRQTTEPSGPGGIGERPGGGRVTTESTPSDTTEPGKPGTTTTTTEAADVPASGRPLEGDRDGDDDDDGGTSIVALAAVGFAGLVLGVLLAAVPLGAALARRRRPAPLPYAAGPVGAPAPPAMAPSPGGPVVGPAPSREEAAARSDRAALAEALMDLRDQVPSTALAEEAARALAGVGITEIRPDGQPFDPARQRAVDQVDTDDLARHNTVVSTERPGYADGERVVRLPEVVVARHEEGA